MTQQEIADRLGLSSPYIAQMESGFKPPPPEAIVEKMSRILRLNFHESRQFMDSAEAERELQSLVKATRKVGYILAGNKVCVPQKSVAFQSQKEIDLLLEAIPPEVSFHLDLSRLRLRPSLLHEGPISLTTPDELRNWTLSELGDRPSVWLAFIGLLYDVLILTPDDRLLCRNASQARLEITKYGRDVGVFFQNLARVIDNANAMANEQHLPDVIAPHEAWKEIEELLGNEPVQPMERILPRRDDGTIRQIQVISQVPPGAEHLEPQAGLGTLGLPSDWFKPDGRYEACLVQSDAYVSLGVWPGCKAVYEVDGLVENNDLVVVFIGDRLYIRRFYDMGESIMLQGGPLSKPMQIKKEENTVRITGVVRELIARFKDVR